MIVESMRSALAGIERDIAARERALEHLRCMAHGLRETLAFYGAEAEADSALPSSGRFVTGGEPKAARNALYHILREAEQPMHARALLAALRARGITIVGKDPIANVRAHLSHDLRFMPVGGGRWGLASRATVYGDWQAEGVNQVAG